MEGNAYKGFVFNARGEDAYHWLNTNLMPFEVYTLQTIIDNENAFFHSTLLEL